MCVRRKKRKCLYGEKRRRRTWEEMASITIKIPDDVMKVFEEFKIRRKYKYVLLEIDDKEYVDSLLPPAATARNSASNESSLLFVVSSDSR